jgi:hypothetical protein
LLSPHRRSQHYVQDHCESERQASNYLAQYLHEPPLTRKPTKAFAIPGYELLRVVDNESGTRTFLAQNDEDNKVYTIKCTHKRSLTAANAVKRALSEQQCLKLTTQLSLPFLPRLYRSFHDSEQLVMILVSARM